MSSKKGENYVPTVAETINKTFTRGSDWPDKDDLLDVVYWGKQAFALVIGILCGILPIYGLMGLILYVASSSVLSHMYVTQFQNMDEEVMGGFFEIAKEGFGSAFATFLVSWISVYSFMHHS